MLLKIIHKLSSSALSTSRVRKALIGNVYIMATIKSEVKQKSWNIKNFNSVSHRSSTVATYPLWVTRWYFATETAHLHICEHHQMPHTDKSFE